MFLDGPPGVANTKVKIIDLGCARNFKKGEIMKGMYGSPNYAAPEMNDEYDCIVDVFSAGVILYTMMTLKLPFDGRTSKDIIYSVAKN